MTIEAIDWVRIPHPWKTRLYVMATSSCGTIGIGEASVGQVSYAVEGAIRDLRPHLLGCELGDLRQLHLKVGRDIYADGGQVTRAALCGLESAAIDLFTKKHQQSLRTYLGGQAKQEIPYYVNGWYQGPRDPESLAAKIKEMADTGIRGAKIDLFGDSWRALNQRDIDLCLTTLRTIRQEVGDGFSLMVEAHARFDCATALSLAQKMEPYGIEWFEEPLPYHDWSGYKRLVAQSPVKIAAGESLWRYDQFVTLVREIGVPVIQLDPIHVGGVLPSRAIADLCLHENAVLAPHSASGVINAALCAELCLSYPNSYWYEYFSLNKVEDPSYPALSHEMTFDDGVMAKPEAPGIGIGPDILTLQKLHSNDYYPDQNLFRKSWEDRNSNEPFHARQGRPESHPPA